MREVSDPFDRDPIADWTVRGDDVEFVSGSQARNQLGLLLLLLKFFEHQVRFAAGPEEFTEGVVEFVARQASLDADPLDEFEWDGRTVKRHGAQVRNLLRFRECSVSDADLFTGCLIECVAASERSVERVRAALVGRCRSERTELFSPGRLDRITRSALSRAEDHAIAAVVGRMARRLALA